MANIKINQVPTRVQYTAAAGQTDFTYNFPIKEQGDLKVYSRTGSATPDDATDLLTITTEYTVTGAGTADGGIVTLVTGSTISDIVTIVGDKTIDRNAIYNNSSTLKKADLNNDFNDNVMFDKQIDTIANQLTPKYNRSELISEEVREDNLVLPILNDGEIWIGRGDFGDSPDDINSVAIGDFDALGLLDVDYVVGTASDPLTNEQVLGDLVSGMMVNSVTGATGAVLTRTLTGTTDEVGVTNGDGVSGNPTFGLADNLVMPGTEGFVWVTGTTGERPGTPTVGETRWNSTTSQWEGWDGVIWVDFISAGGGGGVTETITQAHTFDVEDIVRFDGSNYVLALADSSENAEAIGVVVKDVDATHFVVQQVGFVDGLFAGKVPGSVYFLDDATAGLLSLAEPEDIGAITKPMFLATSADSGWIYSYRGLVNTDDAGGGPPPSPPAPTMAANATFDGNAVVTIKDSVNVTSITDLGSSDFRINFTVPMDDVSYYAMASAGDGVGDSLAWFGNGPRGEDPTINSWPMRTGSDAQNNDLTWTYVQFWQ